MVWKAAAGQRLDMNGTGIIIETCGGVTLGRLHTARGVNFLWGDQEVASEAAIQAPILPAETKRTASDL